MARSLSDIPSQLKAIFQTMSVGKLLTLAVLVLGTLAGLFMLVSWSGRPEFMPLYSHLSPEDAGEVVALLRERKIEYKLSHDGGTVQIPRQRLYEVRLDLASQGLPRGGSMGFEVFDNTKLGMTEFVQNINYQRALQGELSRTINGLAEVESSRVHIVMAPRSLFIEEEEPATASVILKLRHGRYLSDDQIQGILHLVSSSVPRLNPQHVTVVDQNGNMLAGMQDEHKAARISNDQLEFQHRKEQVIEKRVATMLEKVLGKDKAIVRVACDLDFMQQEKTEEMYLPENQVVRSEQLSSEVSSEAGSSPSGVPGLAANITNPPAQGTTATASTGFEKKDNTRNYEIGKVTSHKVLPVGKVTRLSVAVIVDGTYETETVGTGEQQKEQIKYIPRTAEQMTTLENIVKGAVNFDAARGDKVEIANISFNTDKLIAKADTEPTGTLMDKLKAYSGGVKYLAAGLFVLFSFFFIIRPLIRWLTDTPWQDVELLEHLPKTLAEIEKQYTEGGHKSQFVDQAAQLITANQDNTARLMQQWLKEA